MSVLTRPALEASPLADLHEIAKELGIDGFRRLRKAELVETIIGRQDPEALAAAEAEEAAAAEAAAAAAPEEAPAEDDAEGDADSDRDVVAESDGASRRTRRGGRGRGRRVRDSDPGAESSDDDAEEAPAPAAEERPARRSRNGSGGRGGRAAVASTSEETAEESTVEGVIELIGNGSGFVRVSPPEPADGDVYVSAAQVRRCELVDGDRVSGPVRPPRRSERYPSLVRVDTINGKAADEVVAEGTPFDDLVPAWPSERFPAGGGDATAEAILNLTPIGRGSRVTITGAARAGKTEALRRLAAVLRGVDGVEVAVVLAGVRPEELADWADGGDTPAGLSFAASADVRAQAVERALETAKRQAARGEHAVVLIDTLDGLPGNAARKALAAARAIAGGGSLTVIATASEAQGGETTVIALDRDLTGTGRFPALDLVASGTLRADLLVGEKGAAAIEQARAAQLGL